MAIFTIMVFSSSAYALRANASDEYVYVCQGPHSHRYHKTDKCKGLKRCSTAKKKLTKEEARQRGYTPCKWCYGR